MLKNTNQRLRLLHVMRTLQQESDEQHTVTLSEMSDQLKPYGISFDRKSLYTDVETLREFGMDIVLTKGNRFGYFWANRPFELAELKLLVDAVQSAKFLTAKKSTQLIGKLESLASTHDAKSLRRQVFYSTAVSKPRMKASITRLISCMKQFRKIGRSLSSISNIR